MSNYTLAEAAEKSGATKRQIDYWCRQGLFGPKMTHPGTGNHREFTFSQIERIRVAANVSALFAKYDMKVSMKLLRQVVAKHDEDPIRFRAKGATLRLGLPPKKKEAS